MLLSSCKWVSGVSGEMKFGILVRGLKTTYHALRSWLDLRIWKSKHFLMYNFSAADQSTAAGHEDLSPSSLCIPYSDSFGILLPYRSAGCGWPWQLWIIPNPRFSPSLMGLGVTPPPSTSHHPLYLSHHPHTPRPSLQTPYLLLHGPAWVINYLMESIRH